ncbi:hypothetical protein ACFCX4_05295 [Kitasatospora sp. NPDC056327]|uniref:hypothetical protein n=1 Tax=Kitasatospora sp. NPDC056327 TaxID=3345785 RepID=UPI0035D54120
MRTMSVHGNGGHQPGQTQPNGNTNAQFPRVETGGSTEGKQRSLDLAVRIASLVVGLTNLGLTIWEKLNGFFQA